MVQKLSFCLRIKNLIYQCVKFKKTYKSLHNSRLKQDNKKDTCVPRSKVLKVGNFGDFSV